MSGKLNTSIDIMQEWENKTARLEKAKKK